MSQKEYPLCFLDFETTGHDPLKRVNGVLVPWHEIIDIGRVIARQRDLKILGEYSVKVEPEHPERCLPNLVNNFPTRVQRGEWDHALPLSIAIEKLFRFVGQWGSVVIPGGQNFFFDWSFAVVAFAWCGIDEVKWQKYFHYTRFDTRSMAVQELLNPDEIYDPSAYSLRDSRLSKRLGILPEPYPHEGINGARQSYRVFKALTENGFGNSNTR